jgi:ArsR family transcriptional regulator, arsenate/arsenite/antimonite-responsive transcriptional repressor
MQRKKGTAMRRIAEFYGVLADEARLRILWLLLNSGELCVCEIMSILGFGQSKASRHLRILLGAGLVRDRRQGLWVHYSILGSDDPRVGSQLQILKDQMTGTVEAASILQRLRSISCCDGPFKRPSAGRKEHTR